MERNMLRDYLEQIRLLETDIYTMNESISSLQKLKKRMPEYHPPTAPKQIRYRRRRTGFSSCLLGTRKYHLHQSQKKES